MTRFARTLWDLLKQDRTSAVPAARHRSRALTPRSPSMQAKYDTIVAEMKSRYGVRIRKWRKNSSGRAWLIRYDDGRETRLVESPYPRGPMSCAIFLHEIAHHAIGFGTYRPRCLEEYHAWKWALDTMRERGLNVTDAVERRMTRSLQYAVAKARRRGLALLPPELVPYERHN